ncbi:MAG: hypothetical protein ACK54U_03075 [Sphingomonadales bacterium]
MTIELPLTAELGMRDRNEIMDQMHGADVAPLGPAKQIRRIEPGMAGIEPNPAASIEPVSQAPNSPERKRSQSDAEVHHISPFGLWLHQQGEEFLGCSKWQDGLAAAMNNHGLRSMSVPLDPSLTDPIDASRAGPAPATPDHARHIQQQGRVIISGGHSDPFPILPRSVFGKGRKSVRRPDPFQIRKKGLGDNP